MSAYVLVLMWSSITTAIVISKVDFIHCDHGWCVLGGIIGINSSLNTHLFCNIVVPGKGIGLLFALLEDIIYRLGDLEQGLLGHCFSIAV